MRVAVTGARGFIGRHLKKYLTQRDHEVVAINRDDWDLTSQASPPHCSMAATPLCHLSALVHIRGRSTDDQFVKTMVETNVRGSERLARAAADQGAFRFVFMSSAAIFARRNGTAVIDEDTPLHPDTPYGQSKLAAEEALQAIAKDTNLVPVALRPPLVYGAGAPGNFRTLVRLASRGLPVPSGALTARRSLISVTNLCGLIACALEARRPVRDAYVAAEPARPIADVYYGLCAAAGRRPLVVPFPRGALRLALAAAGRSETARAVLDDFVMDAGAAQRELGWAPNDLFVEELGRAMADTSSCASALRA